MERAREARRAGEAGADYKKVRRGWCLGTETFRKELLGQMKERLGAEHYGAERSGRRRWPRTRKGWCGRN